jgi:hypothetical protein
MSMPLLWTIVSHGAYADAAALLLVWGIFFLFLSSHFLDLSYSGGLIA